MARRYALVAVIVAAATAGAALYAAGWRAGAAAARMPTTAVPAQMLPVQPEVIPLPGPQGQGPGQQPAPGQGECEPMILFYYQGRLYQLMPGPDNQPGVPGSPPEYFPLRPYQGPRIPGLPFGPAPGPVPQTPGFQPVQPRF
ncbi:MAG: hypothetical protein QN173_09560 [Armatimonadota bacterium]|nr:hypothetical protein [Armatimonadota bacterium]MDR7436688.1 hypothetical protein [Armatimonadota bacterium]MDR7471240.1 hypothetical protein [Armatimonadota bacterium]MDR7507836.1 hypothetical protein [Armatimonadota bacterium]MDR7510121.1 hypothetical protein [Armatimonadota bacterium]